MTDFYHLSSSATEDDQKDNDLSVDNAVHISAPSTSYLQKIEENNGNELPGSIIGDGKSFESNTTSSKYFRNSNILPGAIGLSGSFDLNTESKEDEQKNMPSIPVSSDSAKLNETIVTAQTYKKKRYITANTKSVESPLRKTDGGIRKKRKAPSSSSLGVHRKRQNTKKSTGTSMKTKMKPRKKSKAQSLRKKSKKGFQTKRTKSTSTRKRKGKPKDLKKKRKKGPKSSKQSRTTKQSKSGTSRSGGVSEKEKTTTDVDVEQPAMASENFEVFEGPRPMNRKMEELQVPAGIGDLEDAQIRGYYEGLVKAYLAPFEKGIKRQSMFDIMRRRTYSLSPPGSNKGVQTILFQLIDKRTYLP